MRLFFVALGMLLSSFTVYSKTTTVQSFDISGRFSACAVVDVDSDVGRVACWGRNEFSTFLGFSNHKAFAPVLLPKFKEPVTQVVTGFQHICVLLATSEVQCWGNNTAGQLGIGSFVPSYSPVSVNLPGNTQKLFSGMYNTCALLSDNSLYCWGDNNQGKLGLGNQGLVPFPALVPLSNVSDASVGQDHMCVIQQGNVLCSGLNNVLQLGVANISGSSIFVANNVSSASQIDVSRTHSCAVLQNGTVSCWGNGGFGQMGNGQNGNFLPVLANGITNAVYVSASVFSTCVVLSSGEISCWGNNSQFSLGNNGPTSNVPTFVTGITNAIQLESGELENCARLANGSIYCWGRGTQALLGDGGNAHPRLNAVVDFGFSQPAKLFSKLALGMDWTLGYSADGKIRSTGNNGSRQLGYGPTGPLSQAPSVSFFAESLAVAPSSSLHTGFRHACSVKMDGGVECWGNNQFGQVGHPTFAGGISTPYQVFAPGIVQKLQTMFESNCALLLDGTVKCWGRNELGQLGDNGTVAASSVPLTVPGLSNVIDLSCPKFGKFCCARKNTGTQLCWGQNNFGQLGIEPTRVAEPSPVEVNWGQNLSKIAQGFDHSCFIDNQGKVFCFGGNLYGNLGDGTFIKSTTPRAVELPAAAQDLKVGLYHTCALLNDSRLYCWGDNYFYAIGVGDGTQSIIRPVHVLSDIVEFDLGYVFSCALDSSSSMWCWGDNTRGNFGNGSNTVFPFPTPVIYKKQK